MNNKNEHLYEDWFAFCSAEIERLLLKQLHLFDFAVVQVFAFHFGFQSEHSELEDRYQNVACRID